MLSIGCDIVSHQKRQTMIGDVSLQLPATVRTLESGPLNPYQKYFRRTAKLLAAAASAFDQSEGKSVGKHSIEIRLFVYIRLARTHRLSSL